MGNLHGSCLNVDKLQRDGSTYFGTGKPDLLSANDVWFMPVVQKIVPDGCLYILDWYDRFHCYQDASADPAGVDRGHGRLYRLVYDKRPQAKILAKASNAELVKELGDPTSWFGRWRCVCSASAVAKAVVDQLVKLVSDADTPIKHRMHAMYALIAGRALSEPVAVALMDHREPAVRAWAVRAAAQLYPDSVPIRERVKTLSRDPSRDVLLQVAIAAGKLNSNRQYESVGRCFGSSGDDKLIPTHRVAELASYVACQRAISSLVEKVDLEKAPGLPSCSLASPKELMCCPAYETVGTNGV